MLKNNNDEQDKQMMWIFVLHSFHCYIQKKNNGEEQGSIFGTLPVSITWQYMDILNHTTLSTTTTTTVTQSVLS